MLQSLGCGNLLAIKRISILVELDLFSSPGKDLIEIA
jgi:hypothetical protein